MWWLMFIYLPLINAQCYWNNKHPYSLFGSKTPYDAVRGDFRDVPPIRGCEPVSIWFVTRHGTRYPSEVELSTMKETAALKDEIIQNFLDGKGDMCAQDIADLRNWKWIDLEKSPSVLTEGGYQELLGFGQRFRQKFHSVLAGLDQSLIRSTDEIRTNKSAKAFIKGLEDLGSTLLIEKSIHEDYTIRPYRFCKKRIYDVNNSSQVSDEISRFQDTPEFKQVRENVQKRIGFDRELSSQTIMSFYNLCRNYRLYSNIKRDAWCALFTDDELQILEYIEDLKIYFKNGHGYPMNSLLGASALKDLFEHFQAAISSDRKSFVGYFSHGTMLDMIYTALGLYYDYPGISGMERIKNRKWRTSFLTPFAANFVAVLHRCRKMTSYSYRIQFFVNEKELHLCDGRVCSWNSFKEKFEPFANASTEFCDDLRESYYV